MKIKVKAIAPTVYQLNSLIAFGMGFKEKGNGSFFASEVFRSVEEAKKFLKERAQSYYEEYPCDEDEYRDVLNEIEKHGVLTLDSVTAYIIEESDEQQ